MKKRHALGLLGLGTLTGVCFKDALESYSDSLFMSDSLVVESIGTVLGIPIELGYALDDVLSPTGPVKDFQMLDFPSSERTGYRWRISFHCPEGIEKPLCYSEENISSVVLEDPSYSRIRTFSGYCLKDGSSCSPLDPIRAKAFDAYEKSKVDF